MKHRIVAEISKSWVNGVPKTDTELISARFEDVIETNDRRGYRLESWKFSQVMLTPVMSETIIAVFVEKGF